jgi:hypothetical protein
MPGATSDRGYPYPTNADPIDVAGDILDLAVAVDDDVDFLYKRRVEAGGEVTPDNNGPTSGTTELIVDTITIPAPGVAGTVVAWCSATWVKTVATDRFQLRLEIAGSIRSASVDDNPSSGAPTVGGGTCIGSLAVSGAADVVINAKFNRVAGTGTATLSSGAWSSIGYLFVPS